jgi:hypothetical protein
MERNTHRILSRSIHPTAMHTAHAKTHAFSQHKDSLSRVEAEHLLAHGSSAERKKAAAALGELRSIHSYDSLLLAIQKKDNDWNTKVAILGALHNIGEKYGYMQSFSSGLAVLEQFIMSNLKDTRLVKVACQAIQWAGTKDDISAVTERIIAAARHKNPAAVPMATNIYVDSICH